MKKPEYLLLIAFIIAAACLAPTAAADSIPGINQPDSKKYLELIDRHHPGGSTKALNQAAEIMEQAENGDAAAQYTVGRVLLENGSAPSAVRFLTLSAAQGNINAQRLLGDIYFIGQGIKQNLKTAIKWYKQAAEQGDPYSQNALGSMYRKGEGVKQDFQKSFEWYLQAAGKNILSAQENIGHMYMEGIGTEQNYRKAHNYLLQAAEKESGAAEFLLGIIAYKGALGKADNNAAFRWFSRSAKHNFPDGITFLGSMYEFGRGVPVDLKKAKELYLKAAAQGSEIAQEKLSSPEFK